MVRAFLRAWSANAGWQQYVVSDGGSPPRPFADPNGDFDCYVNPGAGWSGCVVQTYAGTDYGIAVDSSARKIISFFGEV